jgi:hypothetical protein
MRFTSLSEQAVADVGRLCKPMAGRREAIETALREGAEHAHFLRARGPDLLWAMAFLDLDGQPVSVTAVMRGGVLDALEPDVVEKTEAAQRRKVNVTAHALTSIRERFPAVADYDRMALIKLIIWAVHNGTTFGWQKGKNERLVKATARGRCEDMLLVLPIVTEDGQDIVKTVLTMEQAMANMQQKFPHKARIPR